MDDLFITLWNALTGFIPPEYLGVVCTIVVLANAVSAMTDSTSDNPAISMLKKVLNVIALNIGKNKNADDT